jgi:hypothetical protein
MIVHDRLITEALSSSFTIMARCQPSSQESLCPLDCHVNALRPVASTDRASSERGIYAAIFPRAATKDGEYSKDKMSC